MYYVHVHVCACPQELIHELRITNQMMYLHPPVEAAREALHQDMFAWEAVILQLPRIQHSRYQVRTRTTSMITTAAAACEPRTVASKTMYMWPKADSLKT